jgi:hypothetical protein
MVILLAMTPELRLPRWNVVKRAFDRYFRLWQHLADLGKSANDRFAPIADIPRKSVYPART